MFLKVFFHFDLLTFESSISKGVYLLYSLNSGKRVHTVYSSMLIVRKEILRITSISPFSNLILPCLLNKQIVKVNVQI